MSDWQGAFVWYELMTTDPEAAKAFYRKVVGWEVQDWEGSVEYSMFTTGGTPVAGVFQLPEEARRAGAPTHWLGYVGVADLERMVAAVQERGGQVLMPPHEIEGVGRFAVVADPQGASFALFTPAPGDQGSGGSIQDPGRVGWHELYAADQVSAFEFYNGLFGWTKGEAMDMGPMGTYQIFGVGEQMGGGMMDKPAEVPMPAWLYYFNVGNIDEAAARVGDAGGQVLFGPSQVPGGGWILQGADPQGGMFALFGSRG